MDILFSHTALASFWLPLLAAIIAGIVLLVLQQLLTTQHNHNSVPKSFKEVRKHIHNIVYVDKSNHASNIKLSTNNQKDGPAAVGAILIIAAFFYSQHETLVLNIMTGLTVFVSTFWLFTLAHAYYQNIIYGKGWLGFLLSSLLFIGMSFHIIYLVQHPIFTPNIDKAHMAAMAEGL